MANILYVLNSGNRGGMEKHVLDLVVGMTKSGHVVYLWCPNGPMVEEYSRAGASVSINTIKSDLDLAYIKKLKVFLKAQKVDVIHSHELKASVNSMIAGFLAGVKLRFTHTHTPISTWVIPIWKKIPNILTYSLIVNFLATKEIALNEHIRRIKIKEGVIPSKLVVIPNGIDSEEFNISDQQKAQYRKEIREKYNISQDAFVIGNLSRLSVEKGHDLLIDAFSKLTDEKLYLFIGGGGLLEDTLRTKIKNLHLEKRACVTGVFSQEDGLKFRSSIDLLVFPSVTEGFGYVPLEAMAFGLPVLCSDIDVLKSTCAEYAQYFKSLDALDLQMRITELVHNWNFVLKQTSLAQQFVKDTYSMEKFWQAYGKLYQEGGM